MPNTLATAFTPFVLCLKDLSEGALPDEPVPEDGEPCGGRLVERRVDVRIDMIM